MSLLEEMHEVDALKTSLVAAPDSMMVLHRLSSSRAPVMRLLSAAVEDSAAMMMPSAALEDSAAMMPSAEAEDS